MKNINIKRFIVILVCVITGILLIIDSVGVSNAVVNSIRLCLGTVIPSLFAFMVLSTFLVSSGIVKGKVSIFILSMIGGYPVGTRLISDIAELDSSKKNKYENMLTYCYCASPVYLMAISEIGLYIWFSNVMACTLFAIVVNILGKKKNVHTDISNNQNTIKNLSSQKTGELLIESVVKTGKTLYKMCIIIVLFAVVIHLLEFCKIMQLFPEFIYAFIEITNCIKLNLSPGLTAALTSFGGICVMFQISAITNLNLKKFILSRIPISIMSSIICQAITKNIAIETISKTKTIQLFSGDIVASICLMLMVLMLIIVSNQKSIK